MLRAKQIKKVHQESSMERNNVRAFQVVQFIDMPFKHIDDCVCVPHTWLVVRRPDQRAVVAYPKDEDPFETRNRVKRIERYNDKWKFYLATVKYESDSYRDAEYWIETRNDNGPLVEKELKADMQPMGTVTMELNSYNQHHLSKSNDNFRKTLPRKSIKRPAQSESKKGIDEKRLKLDEAAQSSNVVVNDAKVDPGSSNNKQSIIIQDNQPVKFAQAEETAAASNGDTNTIPRSQSQRIEQKEQTLSSPVKDVDEPTEIINIDNDDHSQGVKKPDQNNKMDQSPFSSNTTASSMTAAKPSTPADQTTLPNQHNNQEHIPGSGSSLSNLRSQIDSVRFFANVHDDHKLLVNEVSSYEPFINRLSRDTLYLHKIPASLYVMDGARRLVPTQEPVEINLKPVMGPISRNLAIAAQNPSNLIDQIISLSMRSVKQPPVVTQNQSQNDPQPVETTKNFDCTANDFGCSSVVRPTADQTPMLTNHQAHPRVILEQEILVTASASSSNQNQQSNDVANKPPEIRHQNLWRFVLPPGYDPHDTRWTLKYRTNLPGLVELMPQSGIHVSYGDLKYCQQVSKDCKSLARRLLPEVFNRLALSVCLPMSEKAQAPDNVGSNIRPELDEQASTALLNFVLEHGRQRGWNTDLKPILSTLHKQIQIWCNG